MPSFEINPNAKKGSERDKKLQNRADAGGVEGRTAAKMMQKKGKGPALPGRTQDMKKVSEEEVVPGIKLVDIILGEEKCGKGMYYCYTDKKCKKLPEGMKMTARYFGGGKEPSEVGIDKPVEGGEGGDSGGNGGGNGGGMGESIAIEDAFGNKFMEVVDLIKPEDIVEKCWKGYKKKGMKTMFGKRYPNCVKANEENEVDEKYQGMYQSPAPTYNRLKSSDEKARMSPGRRAMAKSDELERSEPGSKRAKAQKKAAMQMARNFKSARATKEEVEVSEGDKYDNVGKQAARMSLLNNPGPRSTPEQSAAQKKRLEKKRGMKLDDHPQFKKEEVDKRRAPSELVARLSAKREGHMAQDGPNKAAYDAKQRVLAKTKAKRMKEEANVDEAVRLQAEYGNLLAVVVIWRGKSLMIKMFFPQASMPKREDVQREVEKVYPGCKVTQFRRTELQSEYSPHNDPILRVQKEEAECAGTPKGKDCAVHGQKCCPSLSEEEVDEAAGEKDACYHKVKARYSVWPSAYASGALVKCRKKGAKNWGNKTKKESFELSDWRSDLEEDRLGKPELDEATPRPKATQRGKISKAEAQKRQERADRRAAAQDRRDDKAKAGIDALIGSDDDRKAAAAARANPQGQRQKALKRTIADRMAKGAKDNRLGEKLNLKKADMGEVIDDFYDSDAPQFKGKSKEKRRQMAIAAKLQADEERACWKTHKKVGMKMKGGKLVNDCRPKNEEVELDEAPYQVYGSPDGKKEKKIGKPVKSRKYADGKAAELADIHKKTGGKYRSQYVEGKEDVDENRFASHGGKDSDAGSAYAKPSKGGNKKGVYTLKGKDGKPLFDKNEAIDLKKKSSERKLNTNPGEKPESAKEYRKNSEPLRKHREKFGDLSKVDEAAPKYDKQGNDKFDRYKRMVRHKQDKYGPSTLKQRLKHGGVDYNIDNERKAKNEDWQSVNRKDKTDGLSQKAVNAYRRENPGSKLKTAVTKKPSELKKGSKDAKRRSSFCSRMKGMKKRLTSAKTARDPDSKINKALRRWNCN